MRYNFKEQRPDFYNVREYDSADIESLKELIEDNYPNQQELFESVNYNPYDYMYKRLYDSITNEKEKTGIIELMLEYSPLRNILIDYNSTIVGLPSLDLDWIKADSKQSFNKLDNTQSNCKKICYLFFCETEQDFWDYFAIGYGDTKEMYYYYRKDKLYEGSTLEVAKSREFLLYVYNKTLDLEEEISSPKNISGITDKERKRRVSIVIRSRKEALKLLMDDYDLSDYHDAQMAWDSQILEIRQEFVKDENLPMLKKILNNQN